MEDIESCSEGRYVSRCLGSGGAAGSFGEGTLILQKVTGTGRMEVSVDREDHTEEEGGLSILKDIPMGTAGHLHWL